MQFSTKQWYYAFIVKLTIKKHYMPLQIQHILSVSVNSSILFYSSFIKPWSIFFFYRAFC